MKIFSVALLIMFTCSCAATPPNRAALGMSNNRRLVVLGERVPKEHAIYYRRLYKADVWFTPKRGKVTDSVEKARHSVFGPSKARQKLINELLSTNYSPGDWQIFIPESAERYFLVTLRNMKTSSWNKARGVIVLVDSPYSEEVAKELKRVTEGTFDLMGID